MEHNTCRENLSAYLDGELDLQDGLELEAWLGKHPEALQHLEALRSPGTALRAMLPEGDIPPGWTLRAYQIGAPMPTLGRAERGHPWALQALMRHSAQAWVHGHGAGFARKAVARRRLKLNRGAGKSNGPGSIP